MANPLYKQMHGGREEEEREEMDGWVDGWTDRAYSNQTTSQEVGIQQ